MKINNYSIDLNSSYRKIDFQYTNVNIKIFNSSNIENHNQSIFLHISAKYVKLNVSKMNVSSDEIKDINDLKKLIIEKLIEKLTGKKVKSLSIKEFQKNLSPKTNPELPQQFGAEISYENIKYEKEEVNFKASGVINTKDGRSLNFEISFSLKKELLERTSIDIKVGNVAVIDPLVINFDGNLDNIISDSKFLFDLNIDGKKEDIPLLSSGNGFLVFDKNKNNQIDDGSELFGAKTGNGFLELSQYDIDKNGWIDENDPIFKDLGVWIKTDKEDKIYSLKDKNIGAIYLDNTPTPYTFNLGFLRNSSIYITENMNLGIISKLDFKV